MATLEELRVELDKIDNQMVELYQKRMNVCREVGDYKVKAGRKVYDRQRSRRNLQMWHQRLKMILIRTEFVNYIRS